MDSGLLAPASLVKEWCAIFVWRLHCFEVAPMGGVSDISTKFLRCRKVTEELCAPLQNEDYCVQASFEASPPKWHLAHTSWFFERMILRSRAEALRPEWDVLFNSYYDSLGPYFDKARRGALSRPSVEEVFAYRKEVTERVLSLLERDPTERDLQLVELGRHHEMQHQELLLTDVLQAFAAHPLFPRYSEPRADRDSEGGTSRGATPLRFVRFETSGVREFGARGGDGFSYDNERSRHARVLPPYALADRVVTNSEYLEFVWDGGYSDPSLWLSDGFVTATQKTWRAPAYWRERDGEWFEMTLSGLQPLRLQAPVSFVSYYEADAFARWTGKRLPTEFEWENAAAEIVDPGANFLESGLLQPQAAAEPNATENVWQLFGDVWEWTASAYLPYPGFKPFEGSLGEYNSKFMINQMVLRGGSCLSPRDLVRSTYRNFFSPDARWQAAGIRLAEDL